MPPAASVRAGETGRAHPLGLSRRRRCRRAVARIRGPSRGRGCTGDSQDGTQTLCHLLPKRSTRTGGTRASGPLQALSLVGPRGCATITVAVRESVRAGGRAGCAATGRQGRRARGKPYPEFSFKPSRTTQVGRCCDHVTRSCAGNGEPSESPPPPRPRPRPRLPFPRHASGQRLRPGGAVPAKTPYLHGRATAPSRRCQHRGPTATPQC